jgi:uncharacterized protein HemY
MFNFFARRREIARRNAQKAAHKAALKAAQEVERRLRTERYLEKVAERQADDAELAVLVARTIANVGKLTAEDKVRKLFLEEKYGNAKWQLTAAGFDPDAH